MAKICNSSTQEAEAGALRLSKASLGYTERPTMNLILVTLLYFWSSYILPLLIFLFLLGTLGKVKLASYNQCVPLG